MQIRYDGRRHCCRAKPSGGDCRHRTATTRLWRGWEGRRGTERRCESYRWAYMEGYTGAHMRVLMCSCQQQRVYTRVYERTSPSRDRITFKRHRTYTRILAARSIILRGTRDPFSSWRRRLPFSNKRRMRKRIYILRFGSQTFRKIRPFPFARQISSKLCTYARLSTQHEPHWAAGRLPGGPASVRASTAAAVTVVCNFTINWRQKHERADESILESVSSPHPTIIHTFHLKCIYTPVYMNSYHN